MISMRRARNYTQAVLDTVSLNGFSAPIQVHENRDKLCRTLKVYADVEAMAALRTGLVLSIQDHECPASNLGLVPDCARGKPKKDAHFDNGRGALWSSVLSFLFLARHRPNDYFRVVHEAVDSPSWFMPPRT